MKAFTTAAFVIAGFGALITAINFYLTCVRYPLHQLLKGDQPLKWVSGLPVVGSLFLWIAAAVLWNLGQRQWAIGALFVSLLDTGGLLWFAIAMVTLPKGRP